MMNNIPNGEDRDENQTCYGACMEVAGIESCGLGYGPKEVPVENSESK